MPVNNGYVIIDMKNILWVQILDGNCFFIFIIVAFVDNLFMSGINVCYTRYAKYP